ncbi:MAG: hypothetical protein AABX29_06325 [Nanoarchaeota archaeon]
MPQNRKKLIELFIGNLSNVIVHQISLAATDKDEIASKYKKELETSLSISKKYREKINPKNYTLPEKDIGYIKTQVSNKTISELRKRISQGYKNIDLSLINELVDKALKDTNIV